MWKIPDKGGYTVQPVPTPISIIDDQTNKKKKVLIIKTYII